MSEILSAFFGILFFFRHYSWFEAILQSFSFENTEKTPKNESVVLWAFDFFTLQAWKPRKQNAQKAFSVFVFSHRVSSRKLKKYIAIRQLRFEPFIIGVADVIMAQTQISQISKPSKRRYVADLIIIQIQISQISKPRKRR